MKRLSRLVLLPGLITLMACSGSNEQSQAELAQTQQERPAAAADESDAGHAHDESQAGHSHERSSLHGGDVVMTPTHHFETLLTGDEIRVYVYDDRQAAVASPGPITGTVELSRASGDPLTLPLTLHPADAGAGRSQAYLGAKHDLGTVGAGELKARISVTGLGESPTVYRTALETRDQTQYACPMHPDVRGEDPVACSQCGMALTPQDGGAGGHDHGHEGHDHDH